MTVGVVVMSYGTPSGPEELLGYYTDIRRGRPPTDEQLAELERRYAAIGGLSPLNALSRAQVEGIAAALERLAPGRFLTAYGTKHAAPRIADAAEQLAEAGVEALVGLVLAPHYSALSVGEYVDRVQDAAKQAAIELTVVESWHLLPGLVDLLAERLAAALDSLPAELADVTEVLVTAHSLPARVAEMGDPYPDQLKQTAEAITTAAGVQRWRVAWQSAGRTPEPWLGPDILDVIRSLPAEGLRAVVICPAGFTSDHLEVLYDVDIEALAVAEAAGLVLVRTESLNDDPRLMTALAELVVQAAAPPP
jgi:ferrochelatase